MIAGVVSVNAFSRKCRSCFEMTKHNLWTIVVDEQTRPIAALVPISALPDSGVCPQITALEWASITRVTKRGDDLLAELVESGAAVGIDHFGMKFAVLASTEWIERLYT